MSLARRQFLKAAAVAGATPYFFSSQKSLAAQAAASPAVARDKLGMKPPAPGQIISVDALPGK